MNMDASLIFGTPNTPNALSLGASEPSTGVNTDFSRTMTGQEFAGVMRDLMASSDRQGVAATAAELGPAVANLGFQTMHLGDQISLITTASPLPDGGSLAEFARSQGLGESAVKALFGDLLENPTDAKSAINSASALTWNNLSETQNSFGTPLLSSEGFLAIPTDAKQLIADKDDGLAQESKISIEGAANFDALAGAHSFPNATTLTWLTTHPSVQPANLAEQQLSHSVWENAPHQISDLTTIDSVKPVDAFNGQIGATRSNLQTLAAEDLPNRTNENVATKLSDIDDLLTVNQASGSIQSFSNFSSAHLASSPIATPSKLMAPVNNSVLVNPTSIRPAEQSARTIDAPFLAGKFLSEMTAAVMAPMADSAPTQLANEAPIEIGPIDAMRIRMVPAWETMTRQLAKLNGTDAATPWANLTAASLKTNSSSTATPQAILDLGDTDIGLDLQSDLSIALSRATFDPSTSTVNPSNAEPSRATHSLIGPSTNNSPTAPALEDRSGQIQKLADKLGQAMSERLHDQIDKGQWRLHLKLNPGHLGSIDVELDMHSGGLDALFKTDNTLTRELITQGMSKLREGLAQSGMAVASVWVNSDSQSGSGGNSTPRQNNFAHSDVGDRSPEITKVALTHKEVRSADGWDTLA